MRAYLRAIGQGRAPAAPDDGRGARRDVSRHFGRATARSWRSFSAAVQGESPEELLGSPKPCWRRDADPAESDGAAGHRQSVRWTDEKHRSDPASAIVAAAAGVPCDARGKGRGRSTASR